MKVKSMTEIGQIDVDQDGVLEVFYQVQTGQGFDILLKQNVEGQDYFVKLSPHDEDVITNLVLDTGAGTLAYSYTDKHHHRGGKGGSGRTYHGKNFLDRDDIMRIASRQIKSGGVKVELPTG
jgi:hypothetical protein